MAATHDASCQCINCRSRRMSQQVPVSDLLEQRRDRLTEELNPSHEPTLDDEERAMIAQDPLSVVLSLKESDTSNQQITRILAVAGIDTSEATALLEQAEITMKATRRRRGFRRILEGIGIALFAIFAVEGIMWLISGEFGSFGFIDGVFVLIGLYFVVRGVYEVVTG